MAKIEPTQTKLHYAFDSATIAEAPFNGNFYIDLAQSLSFVNRRKYEQGKVYFIESVKLVLGSGTIYEAAGKDGHVGFNLTTIPDTWITRNAWVKSKALWKEMQDKVLEDNPSVEGKWNQFLVYMDVDHFSGGATDAGPQRNILPINIGGQIISTGEWDMSTFVRPQHEVDPVSGEPLPADDFNGHVLGANVGSLAPGLTLNSAGLIQGYEDTRALVVPGPDVPAEMSESWMTLLTDDGSQEPELAEVIEGEGDNPPYDRTDYTGGDANWTTGTFAFTSVTNIYSPEDLSGGFAVPLGLLRLDLNVYHESASPNATMLLELNIAKGHYKGVACTEMKQNGS